MKSWYILGYTNLGAPYCRKCVAETLKDPGFEDPYIADEHEDFAPIFAEALANPDDEFMCEYCFETLT